jgi:hypothetical protein
VYERYGTLLVSDAGARFKPEDDAPRNWVDLSYRVLDVIDNQVRSLRKRLLLQLGPYRDVSLIYAPGVSFDIAKELITHCENQESASRSWTARRRWTPVARNAKDSHLFDSDPSRLRDFDTQAVRFPADSLASQVGECGRNLSVPPLPSLSVTPLLQEQ